MRLAILFWCYRAAPFCVQRLRTLRHYNPSTPIYVLFSGRSLDEQDFARAMASLIDDFYAYKVPTHPAWRWLNGDLVIAEWFRARGRLLSWDTIAVVQWDMLVLGSVDRVFEGLKADQILLSGTRPIREVEGWWSWVNRDHVAHRARFEQFVTHLGTTFGSLREPFCCVFVVACLPRTFLTLYERYASDAGFLEYRVPMYAQALGIPFADSVRFPVWIREDPRARWYNVRARALNGFGREIAWSIIALQMSLPNGSRLFHPVRRDYHHTSWPTIVDVVSMRLKR